MTGRRAFDLLAVALAVVLCSCDDEAGGRDRAPSMGKGADGADEAEPLAFGGRLPDSEPLNGVPEHSQPPEARPIGVGALDPVEPDAGVDAEVEPDAFKPRPDPTPWREGDPY